MYYDEAIRLLLQHAPKRIQPSASTRDPDDAACEVEDYIEARFLCNKLIADPRLNDLQKQQ